MGEYYPEIAQGGALWFVDLSQPDPTMVFPIITAASFLTMIEVRRRGS
jgi:membrane protein insertase Oxa1/YidC/SpoIIIJ